MLAKSINLSLVVLTLLGIGFAMGAAAPVVPDEPCGLYELGPFTATGYGVPEKDAISDAYLVMGAAIKEISDSLPAGHQVTGVITLGGTYDGVAYDLEYVVIVSSPCPPD